MANANLTLLSTSNVFLDLYILANNMANQLNSLRNGLYYADLGSWTIANGVLTISGPGTALAVSGNALVNQLLTAGSLIVDGTSTFDGNAIFANIEVTGTQTISGVTVITSNAFQLRSNVSTDGDGAYEVWRGSTIKANAAILFNNTANVWQATSNDAQTFDTILTTANLVDNYSSTSNTDAATANAVNAVFAAAISNSAGIVANNGAYVARRQGIDFIASGQITLNVSANVSNSNLTDVTIGTTGSGYEQYSNTGTVTANTNVNCDLGAFFDWTMAGNANVWINNAAPAGNVEMIQVLIRQSANGSNVITWQNVIYWSDNTVPILTTTANCGDILQFITFNGGTSWIGAMIAANMAGMNTATSYGG